MKRYNLHTCILCLLMSLCYSCTDRDIVFKSTLPGESKQSAFICSPPGFDISPTRALERTLIQDTITNQGVSVKITERPWVGTNMDNETDEQTRATWDDVLWERGYSEIGVFTLESDNVNVYYDDKTTADIYIKCFPFRRIDGGGYDEEGKYYTPIGNNNSYNPYNYRNANLSVDARNTVVSTPFFDESQGKELHFYGYFPYQHQTAGIRYGVAATSICRVLQADKHLDNLLAMPYTFSVEQTKDNIKYHDVMYSVSEDSYNIEDYPDSRLDKRHDRNRYGNRYKKRHDYSTNPSIQNDNVHMRFVHSFCRLRIHVSPGNYRSEALSPIKLSELYLVGERVFVDGNLNLIEGIVSPGTASTIHRTLDNGQEETLGDETFVDLRKKNLDISMIVQPTGTIQTLNNFKIICVIDGVNYTYSLPPGSELRPNHVYDINLVLDPDTKILVSSSGGSIINGYLAEEFDGESGVSMNSSSYMINKLENDYPFSSAKWMTVKPDTGWKIFKILKNGKPIDLTTPSIKELPGSNGGLYMPIASTEYEVIKYDVISFPEDWYADPGEINMHLDGKLNTGFVREDVADFKNKLVATWTDISYNNNNGFLYNFETATITHTPNDGVNDRPLGERSGWDGKGLKFDGKDDKVAFPGIINNKGYTVSLYICIEKAQPESLYRWIISPGDDTTNGFPGLVIHNTSTQLRAFGHGKDEFWGGSDNPYSSSSGRILGDDIVQVDYIYKPSSIYLYINGKEVTNKSANSNINSVPWSALGGKLTDISRQAHATYYNVMIYNKALEPSEIIHNYNLNVRRYGTRKTENPESRIYVSSGGASTISVYKEGEFNGSGSTGISIRPASYTFSGIEESKLFTSGKWMTVEPEAGYKILKILEDKVPIDLVADTKPLSGNPDALCLPVTGTDYTVVCIPKANWYVLPEWINMHLDGKLNDGFRNENATNFRNRLTVSWKDISYNGNDGTLNGFTTAASVYASNDGTDTPVGVRSGWDTKGLRFDGTNDKVGFPGKINPTEYTVSVYVCLEKDQQADQNYAWIISGGSQFPGLVLNKWATASPPYRLRIYGHGADAVWNAAANDRTLSDIDAAYPTSGSKVMGEDIVQIDYTFSSGIARLYVDGVLKATRTVTGSVSSAAAMIGGRTNSAIDRQVHMTLYNMMVYDKALDAGEIATNYAVNKSRYGEKKID